LTRFRFRLETVLAWRKAQLEAEEFRLQGLIAERVRLEQAIAEVHSACAKAEREIRAAGSVTGAELASLSRWREAARAQVEALDRERETCERNAAAQRDRIAAARQRCRLLERLKDRSLEEWNHENQRQMDEFASEAYLARWNAH
jgi:flagellar export protein FliJ